MSSKKSKKKEPLDEPVAKIEEPSSKSKKSKKASAVKAAEAVVTTPSFDKAQVQQRGEALIRAYFAANCAPTADLRLLGSIVTDDVRVEYPSGVFEGKEAYLTHVAGTFKRVNCAFHDSTVMWAENASDAAQIDVRFFSETDRAARELLEISVIYLWRGHLSRWWWLLWCVPLCWPCVGAACCCCTCLRKQGRNTYRFRFDKDGQLRICAIKTARSTERDQQQQR
jgi:hypothetical protein